MRGKIEGRPMSLSIPADAWVCHECNRRNRPELVSYCTIYVQETASAPPTPHQVSGQKLEIIMMQSTWFLWRWCKQTSDHRSRIMTDLPQISAIASEFVAGPDDRIRRPGRSSRF
jgi:hypothetical protein